jgi:hypothetical protein
MFMTYREPRTGITNRVHALRPSRDRYETWCGLLGPDEPIDLTINDDDRPCPRCLDALRAEVERNEQALTHSS